MSMTQADALALLGELDDELAHYGVKGMKWGVIREKARPKYSAREIRDARRNVRDDQKALTKKRLKQVVTVNKEQRSANKQEIGKMKASLLRNPDRAVAARMTRGEMAALAIFSIPTSQATLVSAPLMGAAAAYGSYRGRVKIEEKQRRLKERDRQAKKS